MIAKIINTEQELIEQIRKSAELVEERSRCTILDSVDCQRVVKEFIAKYGGYFSALTEIKLETIDYAGPYTQVDIIFKYRISPVHVEKMNAKVDKEIEAIRASLIRPDMIDAVKAFVVHNYLVDNVKYNIREEEEGAYTVSCNQGAYGALILKETVCRGFSEAYKRILNKEGVPCEVITGQVKDSTDGHAWNVVKIGYYYYHIDVTWDAATKTYDYYGLTDKQLRESRRWERFEGVLCCGVVNLRRYAMEEIASHGSAWVASGVPARYLRL